MINSKVIMLRDKCAKLASDCIIMALIGGVLLGAILTSVVYMYNLDVARQAYDAILGEKAEAVCELEATTLDLEFAMNENNELCYELDLLRSSYIILGEKFNSLEFEYNELDRKYTDIYSTYEVDSAYEYKVLKEYLYVIEKTPSTSNITVDVILFMDEKCREWNINPHWMWAIVEAESGYNTNIDNSQSSARGLGQVLNSTARAYWVDIMGNSYYDHSMAYDPYVNIDICTTLVGMNLEKYSSIYTTLQRYSGNGGQTYYNKVVSKGASNGIALTENNAYYPW